MLPTVPINALRNGNLPAWWGENQLFLDAHKSWSGQTQIADGTIGRDESNFSKGFKNAPQSDHFSKSAIAGTTGTGLSVGQAINKAYRYMPRTTFNDLRGIVKTGKFFNKVGRGTGYLGVFFKASEALSDGKITLGEGVSLGISVVSIYVPIVGLTDLGVEMFTGTSLSDRIANGIDYKP